MEYQVNCPHCQAHLKSHQPLPLGKAIQCRKCRGRFTVRQLEDTTLVSAPFQPPPPRSVMTLWLALGGLTLFLLAGAGLTIYSLELPNDEESAIIENLPDKDGPATSTKDKKPEQPPKLQAKVNKTATAKPAKAKAPKQSSPDAGNKDQGPPSDRPPKPAKELAKAGPSAPAPPEPAPTPPPFAAKEANQAIARGVAFLRKHYGGKDLAHWSAGEARSARTDPTGFLALTGLTLLECGVPDTDPLIVAAHRAVLLGVGRVDRTYDLGLSILFLDRLGKKQDGEVIERLALQILARQNPDGGWPYNCPPLNAGGGKMLLRFLRDNRLAVRELAHPKEFLLAIPGRKQKSPAHAEIGAKALPSPAAEKTPSLGSADSPARAKPQPPFRANQLPVGLQHLPVVTQPKLASPQAGRARNRSDNSNTQFAMLGLWIAQKHGIPMERTFNLVDQRFRHTQETDGSWTYTANENPVPPAMTCAGLLGLAVGHGSAQQVTAGGDVIEAPDTVVPSVTDPLIQNGLSFLGQTIGERMDHPNTYLLWSIERVAVLYHLETIGGKDWYSWGARTLADSQRGDGSWFFNNGYTAHSPVVDTCFALLFLKKADFVPNLSRGLRQFIRVRDPNSR
jgi:hypothetical protein